MSAHTRTVCSWRGAVWRHLDPHSGMTLLDVGAGAGQYARAFADWYEIEVVAVEPAEQMRAQMIGHPRVRVLDARGDELPLAPASVDGAWISRVIHHFPDVDAVAAELHRALRPGAPVMLREIFAGRWEGSTLLRAFPRSRTVVAKYPSVEQVCRAFTAAGFEAIALERVVQWVAPDLEAFIGTLRRHGDGLLRILSDDEYDEGLRRLRSGALGEPVTDDVDLLVFRRARTTPPPQQDAREMSTTVPPAAVPASAVQGLRPHAWKTSRSPYGWMSKRDGEIVKAILLRAAPRPARPLRIGEWGSGQTTLEFSRLLSEAGVRFHWLALEYDRAFFDAAVAPALLQRPGSVLRYVDDLRTAHGPDGDGRASVEAVCWNRTALRPALPEHAEDRNADLDDYVRYLATSREAYDVIVVDGRMRRRCLLAAADLIEHGGVVLLHDAWHFHYQCALARYPASRFLGDELWIGALHDATLDRLLDGH